MRTCKKCGYQEEDSVEKKFSRFYLRSTGVLCQAECKPCLLQSRKSYYAKIYPERKDNIQAARRARYAADPILREKLDLWRKANYIKAKEVLNKLVAEAKQPGCSRCSEKDPVCLEMHHRERDDKEIEVSRIRIGPRTGWTEEKVKEEIAKCDILCANCHKKEHRDRLTGGWRKGKPRKYGAAPLTTPSSNI